MPRKKIYIFVGIAIAALLLTRLGFKFNNRLKEFEHERQWYAQRLNYNFSAAVDTIVFLEGDVGLGRLLCTLTKGAIDNTVENDLNKKLKHFRKLRFNEDYHHGIVKFIMPGAERYLKNDSVVVNSMINDIRIFRKGKQIYADKLSNLLESRITGIK
jgi:hypothetical protein